MVPFQPLYLWIRSHFTHSLFRCPSGSCAGGGMHLRAVVGENIRALRENRDMAQDELAHQSEVHPTYLSGVETGKRNITLNVLERIARALGVSEEVLVRRPPPSE